MLLTGSHNLTAGGPVANFETGTVITFDPSTPDGRILLESVRDAFIERLIDDTSVCLPLTPGSLSSILTDVSLRIGDEDVPRPGERAGENSGVPSGTRASRAVATKEAIRCQIFCWNRGCT